MDKRYSTTHIKTERLWLRGIDGSDTGTIVAIRSNRDIYRYFTSPHKLTEKEHLDWFRNQYLGSDTRMDWIAIHDTSGSVVGLYNATKLAGGQVELGYLTVEGWQGKGYTKEAVQAVVHWAAGCWQAGCCLIRVHRDNLRSVSFAEHLGFCYQRCEGNFRIYERRF